MTIDVGAMVYGLGVIEDTVVVVCDRKGCGTCNVVGWNLPAGDCVPDARVDCKDSAWTVYLDSGWPMREVHGATISSNFHYVALKTADYDLSV